MERTVLGNYRIEHEVGKGPTGHVYRGRTIGAEAPVAVKVMRGSLAPSLVAGARSQAAVQASVNVGHPGVAALETVSAEDGAAYVVSSWATGDSLATVLGLGGGRLPLPEAGAIVAEVLDALAAAHAVGLVHGDLKPGNVLVTSGGGVSKPVLVDFGVAALLADNGVGRGGQGAVPNLPYRCPEQIPDPAALSPAADVYAAGAILYEALAGTPPFGREPADSVARAHSEARPTPLRQVDGALPAALDELVASALAKDPAARPSAIAFRDALRAELAPRPTPQAEVAAPAAAQATRDHAPTPATPAMSTIPAGYGSPEPTATSSGGGGFSASGTVAEGEMRVVQAPPPRRKKGPAVGAGSDHFSSDGTVADGDMAAIQAPPPRRKSAGAANARFSGAGTVADGEMRVVTPPSAAPARRRDPGAAAAPPNANADAPSTGGSTPSWLVPAVVVAALALLALILFVVLR